MGGERAAGVVLVGGTFDPPHRGHVELSAAARDLVAPGARLVFVPAARSPHKSSGPMASDADRVAMLRLAVAGVPGAEVWTDEIDRASEGEPSYWVTTLERARELFTGERLWFVIGADQAVALHRWREPVRILSLADAIVLPREPWRDADSLRAALIASGAWDRGEIDRLTGAFADVGVIQTSGTEIRCALERGENAAAMLHSGVADYIARRALYRRHGTDEPRAT
jgi:nicotinate-nucleotide adenylyltransferase